MPVISMEGGKLTAEQKRTLIQRFTEMASEVTHIPKQFFVVTLKEMDDDNLGMGGDTVTDIKAKRAQAQQGH